MNQTVYNSNAKLLHLTDCDITFTTFGDFVYIYSNILIMPDIMWQDGKYGCLGDGRYGRLGEHITIGYDGRGWNIHETRYETKNENENKGSIFKKLPSTYYNVAKRTGAINPVLGGKANSNMNILQVWNNMICQIGGLTNGGAPVPVPAHQEKQRKRDRQEFLTPQQIVDLVVPEDSVALLQIPYQNKRASITIPSVSRNYLFVHNDDLRTSHLYIGISMEPSDLNAP